MTRPPRVSLVAEKSYDRRAVDDAVQKLLVPLGGMGSFVKPGDRVIVKPNLILAKPAHMAVTTHPEVVRSVCRLALDCGGRVSVGDSPGKGSVRRAGAVAGYNPVLADLGIDLVEFTPREIVFDRPVGDFDRPVGVASSRVCAKLTLAAELLDADLVINVPKLKTHGMMLMTLAVKNLFGAVLGLQKFQWHLRAGKDKALFGKVIYEICRAVNPGLSVVDAIVSMDGEGPTSGIPNSTGFLAAGGDPSAIDAVLMDIVGLERSDLHTLAAAADAGDGAWKDAEVVGASVNDLRPARWTLPGAQSAALPLPLFCQKIPFLREWLRTQATAKPVSVRDKCVSCGDCVAVCPAQVMTLTDRGVAIDHARCIRCYCCQELCPHDAIETRKGFLGRLLS